MREKGEMESPFLAIRSSRLKTVFTDLPMMAAMSLSALGPFARPSVLLVEDLR
jgi:hypothetical protein